MTTKLRESDILRTVMDGLAAKRIWHMRCNSGGMFGTHKGKRWAVKFGRKGMADILAIESSGLYNGGSKWPDQQGQVVIWIECKRPGEKQTADQIAFQDEVEAEGHRYELIHSWEELEAAL